MQEHSPRWRTAAALAACVVGIGTLVYLHQGRQKPVVSGETVPAAAAAPLRSTQPATTAEGTNPLTSPGSLVPRPQLRVSSFMPDLRRAADSGDSAAACSLAFELSGCMAMQGMDVSDSAGAGLRDSPEQPLATLAKHHQRCSGATEADLADRYRYQTQAFASGGPAAERWYVQSPMLGEEDFLTNSADAVDFRRRAPAYVARALQRRGIEDLKLLLQIYMPPGYGQVTSRLRIRDDAMFLALADAADRAGVDDEQAKPLAAYLRPRVGADVLARVTERASRTSGSWGGAPGAETEAPNGSFGPESCTAIKRSQ